MERIVKDGNGYGLDAGSCRYCYKFRFLWGLEDGTLIPEGASSDSYNEWFEQLAQGFLVELRMKMFHEKIEDLVSKSAERLARKELLSDGEKISVLIEKEERAELQRLLKKYGQ